MEIVVQDIDFKELDLIENYDSLIWTERYSLAGDFELMLPATKKNRTILDTAVNLRIPSSERTMICESRFEQAGSIRVKGRSFESVLDRRVVETAGNVAFTSATNYIIQMLRHNIGEAADETRRVFAFFAIPNLPLGFTDPLTFDGVKYGENLYTAVKTLCDSLNLGFKITIPLNTPYIEFRFLYGQDLTIRKGINFSESIGNIQNVSQLRSDLTLKNVAVVNLPPRDNTPGLGDVYRVTDPAKPVPQGLYRREVWTDASDLRKDETFSVDNKPARATAWGRIELLGHPPVNEVDFELSSSNVYEYDKDYFLGDLMNVINPEGQPIKHRVTEYIQSFGPEGSSAYPTLTAV